jgi:RNA polymerase sigma-70 factor (ECF subfamily)
MHCNGPAPCVSDDSRAPLSPLVGSDARMNGYRPMAPREVASEADLMRQVGDGSEEALAVLHRRFAPLIFGLAVQTLDRATAEDLVQEVFLALWRNATRFDPERGTLGAWVRQIAHFRLLNELRRQSRQPAIVPDPEGLVLDGLPARDPGPAEATWQGHCHAVLKSALDDLPPLQRQALGLALVDDLTHEQVAAELGLPLGTAKTRIRAGLVKLRGKLGPEWATACSPTSARLVALGIGHVSRL